MPIKHFIVGRKFGKWKVLAEAPSAITKGGHKRKSFCRCDCGLEKIVFNQDLIYGYSTGCSKCKNPSQLRHGYARRGNKHKTYEIWSGMIKRCTNPNSKSFHDYGGRGITVCPQWMEFQSFFDDMGECPKGLTLGRINNDLGYEPSNCRWETRKMQNRNKRNNHIVTVNGITGCLTDVAEHFGLNSAVVHTRLKLGWLMEKAFTTPRLR